MIGWIALNRQIQANWVWEDKPFSRGQAWIDLLLQVNHNDKKTFYNGKPITVHRGEKITSEEKLAACWGWSRKKVHTFLVDLQNDGMIEFKKISKGTGLKVLNYATYQDVYKNDDDSGNSKSTAKEQDKHITGTSEEQQKNITGTQTTIITNKTMSNNDKQGVYKQIQDLYNDTCASFPRCTKLSDSRQKALKARLNTYSLEDFKQLFQLAEESSFLKGSNNRNWRATFDWLIKDANMAKVLDGNYADQGGGRDPGVKPPKAAGKTFDQLAAEAKRLAAWEVD